MEMEMGRPTRVELLPYEVGVVDREDELEALV
jgi:hypothetical protein